MTGKEVYPSLLSKAAAICRSLISNHPFVDGNKRTGIHVMLIFLEINGVQPDYMQDELIELGLGVAAGKFDVNAILEPVDTTRNAQLAVGFSAFQGDFSQATLMSRKINEETRKIRL